MPSQQPAHNTQPSKNHVCISPNQQTACLTAVVRSPRAALVAEADTAELHNSLNNHPGDSCLSQQPLRQKVLLLNCFERTAPPGRQWHACDTLATPTQPVQRDIIHSLSVVIGGNCDRNTSDLCPPALLHCLWYVQKTHCGYQEPAPDGGPGQHKVRSNLNRLYPQTPQTRLHTVTTEPGPTNPSIEVHQTIPSYSENRGKPPCKHRCVADKMLSLPTAHH